MSRSGITEEEARARLARDGPNELPAQPRRGLLAGIGHQLAEPLQVLLLVAGFLTLFVTGDRLEGLAILTIVGINSFVGAMQERRADAAVHALRELTAPTARVVRGGTTRSVPARELVVGDVVDVTAGDRVPADLRLAEAKGLAVDEQILTGESLPTEKSTGATEDPSVGCLYAGTLVVRGHATATVVGTGSATAIGRIGGALGAAPRSPLEQDLRRVATRMAVMAVGVGLVLVPVSYVRARGSEDALLGAVLVGTALAVAAIPEGLPAIVNSALALGGLRMANRGAIVRRLTAVESLGATTVLCVDKTGTLTTGHLVVAEAVAVPGREEALWLAATRCNDAVDGIGDPVEVALLDAAAERGSSDGPGRRVAEVPFDTASRTMITVDERDGDVITSIKGAPEVVLGACATSGADELMPHVDRLTSQGLRVLAIADAPGADLTGRAWRPLGVVAFRDPLRPTARQAVEECHRAGIRVVMVTGDHAATAQSIAQEVGLPPGDVVTGADLAGLPPEARADALVRAAVVARVDPTVKLELIRAHRARGEVVAMTGDGVNDAAALRQADVGVALAGAAGTDVAREAAALVVTDGDLGTIVAAVNEGRRIFRNVQSTIGYLLSGNLSEVMVVVAAFPLLRGLAVPFLPIQLLWINLMTDAVPALALGVDRPPGEAVDRSARRRRAGLLDRRRLAVLAARAFVVTAAVLAAGWFASSQGWTDEVIRSQLLAALLYAHLLLALVSRTDGPALAAGWWRNGYLTAAVAGSVALQVVAFTWEPAQRLLRLAPLPAAGWMVALVAAIASFVVIEIGRAAARRMEVRNPWAPASAASTRGPASSGRGSPAGRRTAARRA